MSLLQNDEFVIYQLRTAFLTHNRDAYPERLITVNTSVLNDPAFRAAGWAPNASEIKRTYSPPIPTVVTSEYFRAPAPAELDAPSGFGDDEEEGGMVTGGGGSNDTVGPTRDVRRRRRREREMEDEDSSDLSDESDEADEPTAVQQLKFTKMPLRSRAGSSPLQESNVKKNGPSVMVTSPSKPPDNDHLKRGDSISTVETIKGRPRRDTTTSSELSSENEIEQSLFRKRTINGQRAANASKMLTLRIQEAEREDDEPGHEDGEDAGVDSDDSSITSEFSGTADSTSILGEVGDDLTSPLETRLPQLPPLPGGTPRDNSPRKSKQPPPVLQALPPPRPISIIQPSSLLSMALKVKNKKPESPFEQFATLSGKGDPNPLYIKLYLPHCKSIKVSELLIRRTTDSGNPVTVAEAIGLALYRYGEENLEPPIEGSKMNINCWNFRMVEDEEVEYDFSAITRTKPMTDFTSNNNRPQRGRARDKPWDEFALVEASEREFQDNERQTPKYSQEAKAAQEASEVAAAAPNIQIKSEHPSPIPTPAPRNPIMGPIFTATTRKDSSNLLDAPAGPVSHAVPRTGPPKTITIHFTDDNFLTRTTAIEVTTDTYIAEVFDQVCKKLNVDKAIYVLKVHGSSTVAPTDRTIEALGDRSELDLVRRRFMGADGVAGIGLAGSPASGSPNAPLLITPGGTTTKKTKSGKQVIVGPTPLHPLAARNDAFLTANNYKRFNVIRKQPMSFSSSSSRVLALDGEYLHIMPSQEGHGAGGKGLLEAPGKTTTVHYSSVVGCKVSRRHPRMLSVHVYKEKETKRYDFEARSQPEANEIIREIKKGVERFQEGVM
ncbi:hypothetical protein NA57DRAFT_37284 [Rhizodiscina lignyota]|uniref:SIN1-domain-containing protein n=1 Tax=Rhizodiscina lignyota TaxID=1504668 RepID=A0A9P4M7H1_9PEZI|nr:hypothetical protein NA57DRAFT_37284 [Rhizodiscina lignyota]